MEEKMKKWLIITAALSILAGATSVTVAGPEEDRKVYQDYYKKRFPDIPFDDFANGLYSLDSNLRAQWESIEEFPPYEIAVEEGENLLNAPFKNGKSLAECFPKKGVGIADQYPYFDTENGEVITLALAINNCLVKNGEQKYKYKSGKIASVLAYMAMTTRGKKINTKIPDDPRALAAYNDGKKFYYARRGQLNLSCAHCHIDNVGYKLRANLLGPGVGQVSHFPVYRSKWGDVGTLHRRFTGCNKQVRAKPFKAQSKEYRNLEYFMSYMSNGLKWNGPGSRF
jgi:sulfur-oxidizing protein SoxA